MTDLLFFRHRGGRCLPVPPAASFSRGGWRLSAFPSPWHAPGRCSTALRRRGGPAPRRGEKKLSVITANLPYVCMYMDIAISLSFVLRLPWGRVRGSNGHLYALTTQKYACMGYLHDDCWVPFSAAHVHHRFPLCHQAARDQGGGRRRVQSGSEP